MKLNEVFDIILDETRYGTKFGDYRDFDKKYYPEPEEVVDKPKIEPAGSIVDGSGNIWSKQIKAVVYERVRFSHTLNALPIEWQAYTLGQIRQFIEGKIPIKPERKHTIDSLVWDIRHRDPSIKILFSIDGKARVINFKSIILGYDKYSNLFTA